MKRMRQALLAFWKKETVLSIAILLAVISMILIPPDEEYIGYIEVRTLGILFCLMTVVAGLREIGVFDWMAQALLRRVKGMTGIVMILVLLCFFLSMLITNDVALITFVPLTMIIMKRLPSELREGWMLKVVVMQTLAANLGSMLMPIGNPHNLYLYGRAEIGVWEFVRLMLPYTLVSLGLLLGWISIAIVRDTRKRKDGETVAAVRVVAGESSADAMGAKNPLDKTGTLITYLVLFGISLLSVAHILPFWIPFIVVLLYALIFDRQILGRVDYSLLGTFVALFIFIGNLGRISSFSSFLQSTVQGREALTVIVASQVMSNVPASVLLSGFTDNYSGLIIGANLGGLGTLIASMASLISFKYIAREETGLRSRYFRIFTVANFIFLGILIIEFYIL